MSDRIGSATVADLQALVDEAAVASGVVGAQVSVILDDRRADFVQGSANAELNIPMTGATVVQVGSVTKMLNAAIVMALAEEGKLELDAPVVRYLPDLRLVEQREETTTLRQMLSMSSGLDNAPYAPFKGDHSLARYVGLLRDVPPLFPAGQGFGYSNAGTCIAALAAEQVSGLAWDELMRTRIFEPAGLAHSVTLAEELPFHRVAVGHVPAREGQAAQVVRPWYFAQAAAPSGSTLAASAGDLARFGQVFINGGNAANGTRVLSESSVVAMMTPTTPVPITVPQWGVGKMWGLGPNMANWGNTVAWGHAGGTHSGGSQLIWFPQKRGVLAFVINTIAAFDAFTARMSGDFSEAVFGVRADKLAVPDTPAAIHDSGRFIGDYARCGSRYEISARASRLRYRESNTGSGMPGEVLGVIVEGDMTPLGGDRFLVDLPGRATGLPIAFFGSGERGRATNVVVPMYAARRAP